MKKYNRILLKLSGEALMGNKSYGIDAQRLNQYVQEIKSIVEAGTQVGIVIGGGNIFRGLTGLNSGIDRLQGDYMGMLATVINSMALQSALETKEVATKLLGGLTIEPVCEQFSGQKAEEYFKQGKVVIIAAGTGNPYFTTDTAASLRAIEIKADAILKGTRVDGIYTADPEKFPEATKYDELKYHEAIEKELNIMDLTAFTLCKENEMPIIVFDMNKAGNLKRLVQGEKIGTLVN
ncbi:MAG: UMP kinase [Bacteroidota bacterium]